MLKAIARKVAVVEGKVQAMAEARVSTAYYLDRLATEDDVAVVVTEEDFAAAQRELVASVRSVGLRAAHRRAAPLRRLKDPGTVPRSWNITRGFEGHLSARTSAPYLLPEAFWLPSQAPGPPDLRSRSSSATWRGMHCREIGSSRGRRGKLVKATPPRQLEDRIVTERARQICNTKLAYGLGGDIGSRTRSRFWNIECSRGSEVRLKGSAYQASSSP